MGLLSRFPLVYPIADNIILQLNPIISLDKTTEQMPKGTHQYLFAQIVVSSCTMTYPFGMMVLGGTINTITRGWKLAARCTNWFAKDPALPNGGFKPTTSWSPDAMKEAITLVISGGNM